MDAQTRHDQLEETTAAALSQLSQELAEGHSQSFIDLLAFYARLHRYSIRNTILIRAQLPTRSNA